MRNSNLKTEDYNGNIKQDPWDQDEKTKPKKSKWFKWLRSLLEFIVADILILYIQNLDVE